MDNHDDNDISNDKKNDATIADTATTTTRQQQQQNQHGKKSAVENPYRDAPANLTPSDAVRFALRRNFDAATLRLTFLFTLQGLLKHGLTEADKIVLSALSASYDQGVYALASSYGGLAARILFQPLEENARLYFSRQGARLVEVAKNSSNNIDKDQNDNDVNGDDDDGLRYRLLLIDLENTYTSLLRAVLHIGLLFACIGSNYTSLLLRLLAGRRWGSDVAASSALSAFCAYTAFLAWNGTAEAFVYGVARSGRDVGRLGVAHAVVGAVFACLAPGLVRAEGAVGLIGANCVCMALRAAYSGRYAARYFAEARASFPAAGSGPSGSSSIALVRRILPHPVVLVAFVASYFVTRTSRDRTGVYRGGEGAARTAIRLADSYDANIGFVLRAAAKHVAVGVACVTVIVVLCFRFDGEFRSGVRRLIKRKSA